MINGATPHLDSEVELVHAVAGRVRLRVTNRSLNFKGNPLTKQLQQQKGIKEVRFNEQTGSLVIAFDPNNLSQVQLFEALKYWGIRQTPIASREMTLINSSSKNYSEAIGKLKSFIPPVVGVLTARWLAVSGWRSILVYIIAAELARQVIKQLELEGLGLPERDTLSKLEYD
jgi:Heavy metal associated domain 2